MDFFENIKYWKESKSWCLRYFNHRNYLSKFPLLNYPLEHKPGHFVVLLSLISLLSFNLLMSLFYFTCSCFYFIYLVYKLAAWEWEWYWITKLQKSLIIQTFPFCFSLISLFTFLCQYNLNILMTLC